MISYYKGDIIAEQLDPKLDDLDHEKDGMIAYCEMIPALLSEKRNLSMDSLMNAYLANADENGAIKTSVLQEDVLAKVSEPYRVMIKEIL